MRTVLWSGPVFAVFLFFFQNFVATPANVRAVDEMEALKKGTGALRDVVFQRNIRGEEGWYFIYFLDRERGRILGGFNYLEMEDSRPVKMCAN